MTLTVDDRELIEGMNVFADTMEGVNRYYMTSQTVHERKVLVRKAADRLQSLLSDRDKLELALRDTLSVCEYVLSKPDAYDGYFSQLVHAHVEAARAALTQTEVP